VFRLHEGRLSNFLAPPCIKIAPKFGFHLLQHLHHAHHVLLVLIRLLEIQCACQVVKINSSYTFKIIIFCVDIQSTGLINGGLIIEQISSVSWDELKENINAYYPNFVSKNYNFATETCAKAYLHSTQTTCGSNMFMMRTHNYIWECISCLVGMYKPTLTLLYTDCKPCSGNLCPELPEPCGKTNKIYTLHSNPLYTNYFRYYYD